MQNYQKTIEICPSWDTLKLFLILDEEKKRIFRSLEDIPLKVDEKTKRVILKLEKWYGSLNIKDGIWSPMFWSREEMIEIEEMKLYLLELLQLQFGEEYKIQFYSIVKNRIVSSRIEYEKLTDAVISPTHFLKEILDADCITINYILLKNNVVLSKKWYSTWKQIQDEYDDYKTSLWPWTKNDLIGYFEDDYWNESEWPFSKQTIENFFSSEVTEIYCYSW